MDIFFLCFFAVMLVAAIKWKDYKRKHNKPVFWIDSFNVWWNGFFFARSLYLLWVVGG